MAATNGVWSEKILHLLRRMNNFYSTGVQPAAGGRCWTLSRSGLVREQVGSCGRCPPESETGGLHYLPERMEGRGLFGVKRYGVHINGYTVGESGEVSMWLARRSRTKQTYPGLLDNVAAGGLAAGVGIRHTLIKECQEEACIPSAIAATARPVSTVSYTYEDEEGVFPESQFVFDLQLPADFRPRVGDGEVLEFHLLPIEKKRSIRSWCRGSTRPYEQQELHVMLLEEVDLETRETPGPELWLTR
uniref:Nudix hydrolase domain-containing protein n=1 Tax=Nothobranchius furzeri TaxID=105023 RepID=A0A1A8UEQ4_NOTFU